jgi:PAS domain S-box-containing protein
MNRKILRRLGIGLSLAAAVAGLAVLVFLALEVARKLSLLETASSDNVQWTLSQAEVEFLELQTAVADGLLTGAPDLDFIRREFDIFYSRVDTLSTSPLYSALGENTRYAEALGIAVGFLGTAAPIIDADDANLTGQLPALSVLIAEARPAVRALSVAGLEYFAGAADLRRQAVARTLTRLAVATVALLSILIVAALFLARLVRIGERRTQDLQLASARLGTIVSTSLDAIVVADRMGRIVEFNPAAERIFGYARDEVLGQRMGELIVPEKHRAAHEAGMKRYRKTGTKRVIGKGRVKLEAQRKDGEVFPVELAIESAEGASGEIFISFLRDISHRVAAEQELVRARDQAVAGEKAKTEFLAVMSHEIRTPLNGLLGTLSLIKDTRLNNRQKGYVANMETSGALLLHHVNDVLDISKIRGRQAGAGARARGSQRAGAGRHRQPARRRLGRAQHARLALGG